MSSEKHFSNMMGNIKFTENVRKSSESTRIFPSCPEDEIVISGIAGRYPKCDNVEEFRYHLYNKVRFHENVCARKCLTNCW